MQTQLQEARVRGGYRNAPETRHTPGAPSWHVDQRRLARDAAEVSAQPLLVVCVGGGGGG
eukprot:COSAG06_NODE_21712_length_748_cov_0.607088_1_plen_59_part_10